MDIITTYIDEMIRLMGCPNKALAQITLYAATEEDSEDKLRYQIARDRLEQQLAVE